MQLKPPLKVEIDAGEKDNERLLDMLWTTQQYLCNTSEDGGRQRKIKRHTIAATKENVAWSFSL